MLEANRKPMEASSRRRVLRWAAALVVVGLVWSGLAGVQAAAPGASLEIEVPTRVEVGEPIALKLVVRDVVDLAGYEARLQFDTQVAEFDGLVQRGNDVKAAGRDVAALGPMLQTDGVT